MSVKEALLEFGLEKRQVVIYLILRSKGPQTILQLSKLTQIPRASLYAEIQKLVQRKIINIYKKNKKQFIEAREPELLLSQLQSRLKIFESSLPMLAALAPVFLEGSQFEHFVGYEESKEAQKKYYKYLAGDKVSLVRSFAHPDLAKTFPKFVPFMIEKRRQMGIATKLLVPLAKKGEVPNYFDGGGKREMRFMPKRYDFNCNCLVGGNHILFIVTNSDSLTVVLMKSKAISGLLSACHAFIWDMVGENK